MTYLLVCFVHISPSQERRDYVFFFCFFFADSLKPRTVPGTYQMFNKYSLKDEFNEGIKILLCRIVVLRI